MISVAVDPRKGNVTVSTSWQAIADQVEGSSSGYPRGILSKHIGGMRLANDRSALSERLEAATSERATIADALARAESSKDVRAPAAIAVLSAALATADERLSFLQGFEQAYSEAEADFTACAAAEAEAAARLQACEPEDAAAESIALASAQAATRKAVRAGWALVEQWRECQAPILPALAAAQARAERVQQAVDALSVAAKETGPLDVACESAGNEHWALVAKARAKRAAKT